jgi:uncharacterized membrane protein
MAWFILGLVLFLGSHSVRVFADNWRVKRLAQWGEKFYKGVYSVASLAGFVLMVYGFSTIRWDSPMLWVPPTGMRHSAALLMLLALVLLVASQVPNNAIKANNGAPGWSVVVDTTTDPTKVMLTVVPEPSVTALAAVGVAVVALRRLRRR